WKMGVNGRDAGQIDGDNTGTIDPFGMFRELGGRTSSRPQKEEAAPETRPVRNAERKAFDTMGLEIDATAVDIKARFKALVKQHHPDANGGDRSYEDRLREIIQAYNYLKSVGFC
ncbi:MAG TPA: J domain-containing protein, partial [Xanthobacteraceae bacterium]|nr:J domain-containing protein [Xanthobacteraceae bacterium]